MTICRRGLGFVHQYCPYDRYIVRFSFRFQGFIVRECLYERSMFEAHTFILREVVYVLHIHSI